MIKMRPIDADSLVKNMEKVCNRSQFGRNTAKYCVKKEPTLDFVPVIHAHVIVNWLGDCRCSNCGDTEINCTKNYCHNCGARFDEPEEHEN